jgi:hypothetical protein
MEQLSGDVMSVLLHVLYVNTHLIKEASFLVIIDTWFWPVFKQVHLALAQQHFCKFNLESPGNKNYTRRKIKHFALIHQSNKINRVPHGRDEYIWMYFIPK